MVEQVNSNNTQDRSVYGFNPADCSDPKLRFGSAVATTAQSTITIAPQTNNTNTKHSFSVITTIKAFFSKIIEGVWNAFNKLRNYLWEIKIDMHMAGVEAAQLNATVMPSLDHSVVPQANAPVEAELPDVPYSTEKLDIVAHSLLEARKAGVGHIAQTKLVALRGAFYNSLYPPTQQKLMRLVNEQLKDPTLKTVKDCLLNKPFWDLFSNSVERLYLQHSILKLKGFHRKVDEVQVPFKASALKEEFAKLSKVDRELFRKAIPLPDILLWSATVNKDRKAQVLDALVGHITSQVEKLALITTFVEMSRIK